jgi:phosphatidylserine decarboxylase
MATTSATVAGAEPRAPAPITSAQPGGGFCHGLELAWGRLRRALLRRFRPGYVRRMLERRQGHCPDCPHDIIDPRDLKFVRNVCGYHFGPENDPYARRGLLPIARAGATELLCFSLLFAALAVLFVLLGAFVHAAWYAPLVVIGLAWVFVISFFRDPERAIPSDSAALVSPADGTVTHVEEVDEADFPGGRALRVSIFLSVFNVHINRNPRPGRVARLQYFPGAFLDARAGDCAVRNEQFWIDYEDGPTGAPIRVKQIAGAIARRIVCWLRPGEAVEKGARLGMIKFGSRTDLLVPVGVVGDVTVKVGDAVRGGSTVLLRLAADKS